MSTDLDRLKNPDSVPAVGAVEAPDVEAKAAPAKPAKAPRKRAAAKVSGGKFKLNDKGVWFVEDASEDGIEGGDKWLGDFLEIVAQVRDIEESEFAVRVRFKNMDGNIKELTIPREKISSDQSTAVLDTYLSKSGYVFSYAMVSKRLLLQYLQAGLNAPRARLVARTGWYQETSAFVLPAEVIGDAGEWLIYDGSLKVPVMAAGAAQSWRDGVSRYAVSNPLLMLTLGAGFAAPLIAWSSIDTGGFHFVGASKKGKSTICDMAASIYGKPNDYRQTWNNTATALEYTTAAFNHLPLLIDEISQAEERGISKAVYALSQGKGKGRGKDTGGLRDLTRWGCFILSNGEEALSNVIKRGGGKVNAGQEVRFIELSADRKNGAFDDLHGFGDASAMCKSMALTANEHHGMIGRDYLNKLAAADRSAFKGLIHDAMDKFKREAVPVGASGQASHVAQYFALCGFAGELATSYGLTGWETGSAWTAAKWMYADWLRGRGGAGDGEDMQIIKQVQHFFEQHGMSRFQADNDEENTTFDEKSAKTLARCGFRKTIELHPGGDLGGVKLSDTEYYVFPNSWRNDVLAGIDYKRANKVLLECGVLIPDSDGKAQWSGRIVGSGRKKVRMYRLTAAALMVAGDE
ncbi:DUF927 domain-containing protein [uncultured Deefgea sp.]|uniref:DUF927 domain-containing protein n=1 Tax=uncultured Deefgea sp. TaxID=1304914 RepID=UPI00259223FA|nr:DUF927 domain-containing protein [uncultured Deefgea sp.]